MKNDNLTSIEVVITQDDMHKLFDLAKSLQMTINITASTCLSYGLSKLEEENKVDNKKTKGYKKDPVVNKMMIKY